eukprot:786947-Amphidinium_carterae.1
MYRNTLNSIENSAHDPTSKRYGLEWSELTFRTGFWVYAAVVGWPSFELTTGRDYLGGHAAKDTSPRSAERRSFRSIIGPLPALQVLHLRTRYDLSPTRVVLLFKLAPFCNGTGPFQICRGGSAEIAKKIFVSYINFTKT